MVSKMTIIVFITITLCPIALMAKNDKKDNLKIKNDSKKEEVIDEKDSKGRSEKGLKSKTLSEKKEALGLPSKEYTDEDFRPKVEEESYVWMVIKTIIILGALVGGFYAFFRFVTKKAGIQVLGGKAIRILSVVPIGQNKYLQVVDLAGKILVLGVSDNNINLISEITDKDEIDRIRLLSTRTPAPERKGFQDYIMRQIGRFANSLSEKGKGKDFSSEFNDQVEDLDYLKKQRNRLKNLNG